VTSRRPLPDQAGTTGTAPLPWAAGSHERGGSLPTEPPLSVCAPVVSGGCSHGRMNTDEASPDDLTALRAAFGVGDGGESALGWEAVRAFEA
jgi:hypothetical protein